jgi:hypothetical protein
MRLTPLTDPLGVLRATPVIPVGRTATPGALAGGLSDLLTTHLRAELLVMAVARVGSEQLLAVRASALTVLGLHATRRDLRTPEENGKTVIAEQDATEPQEPKKEEEIYEKSRKKTQPEEHPLSDRRVPATFRSPLTEGNLLADSRIWGNE